MNSFTLNGDVLELDSEPVCRVLLTLSKAGMMRLRDALEAVGDLNNGEGAYNQGYEEGLEEGKRVASE